MPRQYKNKKHLAWVHNFSCLFRRMKGHPCRGPIQAHHLLRPWSGVRGMGMKASDRNLVPLCMKHHFDLHHRGNEMAYFREITGDENYGKIAAEKYWVASPFNEDEKQND